jgi:hypothetical protein
MAEYKGIKGFKVQYLSADPSDPNIGQTWYNDTSKDLKYTSVTTAGAWATGGNLGYSKNKISRSRYTNCRFSYLVVLHPVLQEQLKNITVLLGQLVEVWIQQDDFRRLWYSNSRLAFGGEAPPTTSATEEYDGSTWTTVVI